MQIMLFCTFEIAIFSNFRALCNIQGRIYLLFSEWFWAGEVGTKRGCAKSGSSNLTRDFKKTFFVFNYLIDLPQNMYCTLLTFYLPIKFAYLPR